jgi:protein-S-isoprenylcysteine O-methyltransferase Ste14
MIFWFISSWGAKKNLPGKDRPLNASFKLIIITVAVMLLFNITGLRKLLNITIFPFTPFVQTVGVFICASGIAFSIWARIHLGKNWGMPMAMKEKPELVMTGPYSFIRHPIYTGILFAMFGSGVAVGFTWLVWFILFSAYFMYSAKKEETLILLQFPEEYKQYMKRTKMIIPFIY